MNNSMMKTNGWLWFTAPIAILLAIAAGGGVFVNGLYRDIPFMVAQAKGQDLISLVVVLPTLIVTGFLAYRGSPRARLIWLGVLVYLVYSYALAAFVIQYNPLFLVYIALLGCSLYALIFDLAAGDQRAIKECSTEKTPVRVVSIFLAVLAVFFYFLWLSEVVPAQLAGEIPQSILDNGTPTNAVHVLDMAWILPALAITAVSLWRKQALGYTLAGAMLSYIVLLILAILSMIVSQVLAGQTVSIAQTAFFAAPFTISLGMLIWYLSGLRSPRGVR